MPAALAGVAATGFPSRLSESSTSLSSDTTSGRHGPGPDGSASIRQSETRPGIYSLSEGPADGFLDGQESLGSLGGLIEQDRFSQIVVPPGGEGTGYDFGELNRAEFDPAGLSGFVYLDADDDGIREPPEVGLPNVPVTLTAVDNLSRAIEVVALTDSEGRYRFDNLAAGVYTLTQTQPSAFNDGRETQGSPALGVVHNDRFVDLALSPGILASDYNFAERGLKAELVSKRLLFASTPPAAELVPELMVTGGSAWYDFYAPEPAIFTATVDSDADDLVIELYTDQMMPVVLSTGQQRVTVPIAGGMSYSIHVAGVPKLPRTPMSVRLSSEDDSSAGSEVYAIETDPSESAALQIRVAATDLAGTPISSVAVGRELLLAVLVEDMRDVPLGVFSAYLDVFCDPGLLSISGPITFGDNFPNGRSADTTVAGHIDEVGAFAGFTALGGGEFLLFGVPMRAEAAGIVALDGQPAGLSPDHDPLLSDIGGPTLAEDVFYGNASLEIVPPVVAVDDLFIVAPGSSNNVFDVLANDVVALGVTATIDGVDSSGVSGLIGILPGDRRLTYAQPGGFTGAERFTYTASDGDGFTDQATVTAAVPESLGSIDFVELPDLNPEAGEIWYGLQTAHDAILTVEAVVEDQAGSAELTLFDEQGEELDRSMLVDGRPRVDRPAQAGTTYYLRVAGTTQDVDLRIANLVNRVGTAITVGRVPEGASISVSTITRCLARLHHDWRRFVKKTNGSSAWSVAFGRVATASSIAAAVSGQIGQRRSIPVFGRGYTAHPVSKSMADFGSVPTSVLPYAALIANKIIARRDMPAASRMSRSCAAANIRLPFLLRAFGRTDLLGRLKLVPYLTGFSISSASEANLNKIRTRWISLPRVTGPRFAYDARRP